MKLLSIALARSVWLVRTSDLNPRGRNLPPLILPFLLDTYKFKEYPKLGDILDETKGIILGGGEFKNRDGESIGIKMTIYNFGIVAESGSSTSDSDLFLETLLTQLTENFNITRYESVITGRDYLSQVYVSTEKLLESINPKLTAISEYVAANLSFFKDVKYQLGSLSFWADPVKSANPLNFVFERQVAVHFSEKRYFSSAPLQTEKHLELLDKIEEILS